MACSCAPGLPIVLGDARLTLTAAIERYDLIILDAGVYNELGREEILKRIQPDADEAPHIPEKMPYIVIVVDELATQVFQRRTELACFPRTAELHTEHAARSVLLKVVK